jgi:hypothetical protein
MNEVEEVWRKFWLPIVSKNGKIDMEQIKKELYDFHTAIENVPKVYCHVTGNRISKANTLSADVIAVADDYQLETFEQWKKDESAG